MQLFTRRRLVPVLCCLAVCVIVLPCTAMAYVALPDNPPANPPFYGAYYITGTDGGRTFTIYTNTPDGWGVNANGYVYRLGGSATGIIYAGSSPVYSTSLASYNLPRYRTSYGDDYTNLELSPTASNILIEDSFSPVYPTSELLLFVVVVILGLMLVLSLRRRG